MMRGTDYPYKLRRETCVRLGGQPKEDSVFQGWRVDFRRTTGRWIHFVLVLEGAPTPAQVLDACAAVDKDAA